MTVRMVSFGGDLFPDTQFFYNDNFGDTLPTSKRLPGVSGEWNEDGDLPPAHRSGVVELGYRLEAENYAAMDALRDGVRKLNSYGWAQLIRQPNDQTAATQFCWARIVQSRMERKKSLRDDSDLWQEVRLVWNVPDPRWFGGSNAQWQFGDGSDWGDAGLKWTSGGVDIAASGTVTDDTITMSGNGVAVPTISIAPGALNSCEDPIIQRLVNSVVIDEVSYVGTLGATDTLTINGAMGRVDLNGVSVWGSGFDYTMPDFFRLLPGSNSIRVKFTNGGDAATVKFMFHDVYR